MTEPYLSSDEYDEQAHQLYNEGRYDDALALLREGLLRYPQSVELHVGIGYAQLAREEYAWARGAFDLALVMDGEHEDALAGLGETQLVLGQIEGALRSFHRIIELGFDDDHELMLQVGRALFREGYFVEARLFFDRAHSHHPDSPEIAASLGYTAHRLGLDADAFYWLRRALELEPEYPEPRIYLANVLYDRGETGPALHHFARIKPDDHFDDLGVWRTIELLKVARGVGDDDPDVQLWLARLAELGGEASAEDMLLAEIESMQPDGTPRDPNQLELFGTLMRDVPEMLKRPAADAGVHVIETLAGLTLRGSWDDLLMHLQTVEGAWADGTLLEFMQAFAQRGTAETGVSIPVTSAEAFIRGSADAGVLRILQ
ncbi:MAG: tetratricopeptide repeat protein [Gemmatimonadota bacterium]